MVRKLESYLADKARIQQDESDLTSRSDLRKDRLKAEGHYMVLSERLCSVSIKRIAQLELSEFLLELIDAVRRIESPAARDRALRRVRKELRDIDIEVLERKLDELDNPGPSAKKTPELLWTNRLLASGEQELEAFLTEYPKADRGHLRTLVRNVSRAKEAERAKATKKLTLALREVLNAKVDDEPNYDETEESST